MKMKSSPNTKTKSLSVSSPSGSVFRLPFSEFQANINKKFSKYKWGPLEIKNNCTQHTPNRKIELSNTQKFVADYFTKDNPNGILLYHSIGSGKTLSGVNILKHFEDNSFNTLWITRTTLKKDLDKALDMIPLKKGLLTFSYKQFSNICKMRGENYRKLLKRSQTLNPTTTDPFYKTVIIIDEAHKLYIKDLKVQEMHDISAIERMIYRSYINSGENRARVVLMTATPMKVINLLNLIITDPTKRIDKNDNFSKENLKESIKGLVSYIDLSKDPTKFAQTTYTNILVPISYLTKDKLDTSVYCKLEKNECKKLSFNVQECNLIYKKCMERIKENKKILKSGRYQTQLLDKKCGL